MTKIRIELQDGVVVIEVEGHAGYGTDKGLPPGCDIVCASASIVSCMAMQRLREMEEEGKLKYLSIKCRTGDVSIVATANQKDDESKSELLSTVMTIRSGYELLADQYPNYICIQGVGEQKFKM